MSCQNNQVIAQQAKAKLQRKYPWLSRDEIEFCYDSAFKDVVLTRYPSMNNANAQKILENNLYMQVVSDRMEEIFEAVGGTNLKMYKENGITWDFGEIGFSSALMRIMPKASVPK